MGKCERLRSRAFSLRGAIAAFGAVVGAASLAQASGTLAASEVTRTAKVEVVSQNYFPTPLASDISCTTSGTAGFRRATVSWSAPNPAPGTAPTSYRYRVDWADEDGNVRYSFETSATSTGAFRIRDELSIGDSTGVSYRIRVHTISTENGAAVSSGYRSHTVHSWSTSNTYCTGDPYPISEAPNAQWENRYDWNTSIISFATTPAPSVFAALFDDDASRGALGEPPEGDELTTLDEVARDATPTTSVDEATLPSSPRPGPSTSTRESAPSATTQPSSARETSESAAGKSPTSQTPRTSTSPVTSLLPEPSPSQSPSRTSPSSSVPVSTTTTATPSVRAGVGDSTIPVGEAFARLEDIDGSTHLVVSRGGTEVCSADVDGASRIEEVNGELTVTVAGRTSKVDIETCEFDVEVHR